ncbi:MAG: glycosyltransferase family 4 protein [Anaerolineae bacterium]|nr:glycosyltransferase family 4 protein [Anaerolineae bacterium]
MRVLLASKAYVVAEYRRKAAELAELGVDLTLVAPASWQDERGRSPLEPGDDSSYRLRVLPLALNGHFHLHWFRGLGGLIRQERPDIVHMEEEPYNLATALALAAARRSGARAVFFTWQNLNRRYPVPFRLLERYCYRTASHALSGNTEAAAVLRAKGYTGPVTVLPQFGVDPDRFSPPPAPPKDFVIGYVGRLVPEKGVDLLLRAAGGLTGEWSLSILGAGPEAKNLQGLAEQLGVAPRVRWHDPVPSPHVPAHLRSLACLVLPSISRPHWKEQFGRVLVEAMACGVPVVGSDSGEIPNVIGPAGLVFPEGDVAALRASLARLQSSPALRRELAVAGRQRVLEHYTQAAIARETVRVYEAVLGRGTGLSLNAQ